MVAKQGGSGHHHHHGFGPDPEGTEDDGGQHHGGADGLREVAARLVEISQFAVVGVILEVPVLVGALVQLGGGRVVVGQGAAAPMRGGVERRFGSIGHRVLEAGGADFGHAVGTFDHGPGAGFPNRRRGADGAGAARFGGPNGGGIRGRRLPSGRRGDFGVVEVAAPDRLRCRARAAADRGSLDVSMQGDLRFIQPGDRIGAGDPPALGGVDVGRDRTPVGAPVVEFGHPGPGSGGRRRLGLRVAQIGLV